MKDTKTDLVEKGVVFITTFIGIGILLFFVALNSQSTMYASHLAKAIDCTYSHVVKLLQEMEKSGLVAFKKQGRLKLLTLTKKGNDVAQCIDDARRKL